MFVRMEPARGSERVKAWVYAVINPWESAVDLSVRLLATGNTTFRFESDDLEYIRTVTRQLGGRGPELILEDLKRLHAEVAPLEREHDGVVSRVREAARGAHAWLSASAHFREVVAAKLDESPSLVSAELKPELSKWMAQRVVNAGRDASANWADFAFWSKHRETLLVFRDDEALQGLIMVLREAAVAFATVRDRLGALRSKLVDDYDIPPAFVA
jgi:hypothetical protein